MDNIPLSVIICTYNRVELLGKCLNSIVAQQFESDSFEVIVVDNNSTDNSRELVAQYQTKITNLRYVFEENQGLSYARNRGYAEARAEYLIYLDDDAIMPREYLSNVNRVIKQYAPDIMGGPVYPYYTSPKPRWFRDEYEIRKYEDESRFSKTCSISGGNYIIKKKVLEDLGMFDVNLGMKGDKIGIGEERKVLEQYRATTPEAEQKVYYALECYVKHHVPEYKMTIKYRMKRYYKSGREAVLVKDRGPGFVATVIINVTREIFNEIRMRGLIQADYVKIAGMIVLRTANVLEVLRQYGFRAIFRSLFGSLRQRLLA
jgi:glycosyltransferase involved in cell wall biosynthesis